MLNPAKSTVAKGKSSSSGTENYLPFRPVNPLVEVSANGVKTLRPDQIDHEGVGWKAFGLAVLPVDWVPPFFVVSSEAVYVRVDLASKVAEGLQASGIHGDDLIVRSSGTAETMSNRGRLVSQTCKKQELVETISALSQRVTSRAAHGKVHWIVQSSKDAIKKGQLSNERYLSLEKRDWVAELEPERGAVGYRMPIAVRRWRDGSDFSNLSLACNSETGLSLRLKRVAMWAMQFRPRLHFEWVWTGHRIWIVQADPAEHIQGVDPFSMLPTDVPEIAPESLRLFRLAIPTDYQRYKKLANARMYADLGYEMPAFYVLDDKAVLSRLIHGELQEDLRKDLVEMCKRPLILRTDGLNIPSNKREMLPRSDELRTVADAESWLIHKFRSRIVDSGLQNSDLCLIAHHFIPSVAAAWARSEPRKRMVRIEALWGLPEGLYWYSHDTFEVDTQDVVLKPFAKTDRKKFRIWKRTRYKGTFIAPDKSGKWIPYHPREPYEWRQTINKQAWLREIADTTRRIAEREQFPVSVMWFIGNHPRATTHEVLPWFHSKSDIGDKPKAAPRRKLTSSRDFRIEDGESWKAFKDAVLRGDTIERVIVEPIDSEFIRNPEFVEDLADLAARHNIVVELAGGILSHAYYILQRRGANVECVDLFGAEEEVMEFNKLVRDRIPEIIQSRGEETQVVTLSGEALVKALRTKLVEEAFEAFDARSGEDLLSELADIEEVVRAIARAIGSSESRVEKERAEKENRRGGFEKGLMLTKTSMAHSLGKSDPGPMPPMLALDVNPEALVVSEPTAIPSSGVYRRPDLRQVDVQTEKLVTYEAEIDKIDQLKETTSFSLPIGKDDDERKFALSLELDRDRSTLRTTVRLRAIPTQLDIDLPDAQLKMEFPE